MNQDSFLEMFSPLDYVEANKIKSKKYNDKIELKFSNALQSFMCADL